MKLAIHKIYCPNCQRLVHSLEQKSNSNTRLVCPKCKEPLRLKTPAGWR